MKRFIYIVDSFFSMDSELRELGVTSEDYNSTGAGGAGYILAKPEWLNAPKLLVFMSSFHGHVEPAVQLSRAIKDANPNAMIVFRSQSEASDDPVFNLCIRKYGEGRIHFIRIIREFISGKPKKRKKR